MNALFMNTFIYLLRQHKRRDLYNKESDIFVVCITFSSGLFFPTFDIYQ